VARTPQIILVLGVCFYAVAGSVAGAQEIHLSEVTAQPGEQVSFTATLSLSAGFGHTVESAFTSFTFDQVNTPIATATSGKPDCIANPPDSGSFQFINSTSVAAAIGVLDVIVDQTVLYTCKVNVAVTAAPGDYLLHITKVEIRYRDGSGVPQVVVGSGVDGLITIPSPTPTRTPTPTQTRTRTITPSATVPTPTPSATATNTPRIRIDIGRGRGGLGDTIPLTVSLTTSGVGVAATSNVISFPFILSVSTCEINPQIALIGKSLVTSGVAGGTRFVVQSIAEAKPIPDGSLYTCMVHISESASPGRYLLTNLQATAFSPTGTVLPDVVGSYGFITVSFVPPVCGGDCSGDGMVTVDELLTLVNIDLGNAPVADCGAGDVNGDGQITINEILAGVNDALNGCP